MAKFDGIHGLKFVKGDKVTLVREPGITGVVLKPLDKFPFNGVWVEWGRPRNTGTVCAQYSQDNIDLILPVNQADIDAYIEKIIDRGLCGE